MPGLKRFSVELTPSVSIIIAGVIIAAAIIFVNLHPGAATAAAPSVAAAAGTVPTPTTSDHILGSPTAPIVLIEYSDFQCPYCDLIYPELKQIQSQSNGQVAWVMRDFPLYQIHPQAMPAAIAAECITAQLGNSAWWKFADDDFANQSSIGTSFFTAEAQKLGANMTQYNSCVSSQQPSAQIEAQIVQAESAGGEGTPFTIVMNTKTDKQYPIPGALPIAQIEAVIQEAQSAQ